MLSSFLQGNLNISQFLLDMLISLPGILLAITIHEAAHGFVAYRCGDPTAKLMGRLTLNPFKHLDLIGFASMVLVGVGWAKPVPVNPNNFKNPRRDDLYVSMAGITANILQFLLGAAIMMAFVGFALRAVPADGYMQEGYIKVATPTGYYFGMYPQGAYMNAAGATRYLVSQELGSVAGVIYQMLTSYAVINVALAAFNLLPIPPLDGYHLFNDLLFKRQLFAPATAQRIGQGLLLVLLFTGLLSKGINFVVNGAFEGVGALCASWFA